MKKIIKKIFKYMFIVVIALVVITLGFYLFAVKTGYRIPRTSMLRKIPGIDLLGVTAQGIPKEDIPEGYTEEYYANPIVDTYTDYNAEYEAYLKETESDIDGMTMYDKYEMGLNPEDGADSDGDGLTDKLEIEVYNSDPMKKSTAGDLYTDKYKVDNGMDPCVYYNNTNEVSFAYNECDEVDFEATTADDLMAVADNITGQDALGDTRIYAEYLIYNCSKAAWIDLTPYGVTPEEVAVLTCTFYDNDTKEVKFEVRENSIKPIMELDANMAYKIFVVSNEDTGFLKSILKSASSLSNSEGGGTAIIYGCPIPALWGKYYFKIYVENAGDLTEAEKQIVVDRFNSMFKNGKYKGISTDHKIIHVSNRMEIMTLREMLSENFSSFEITGNEPDKIRQYFFMYKVLPLDEISAALAEVRQAEENQKVIVTSGFDIYKDELPFKNFGSYLSPGGNCAGMIHHSTVLYNTGSFPATGNGYSRNTITAEKAENGKPARHLKLDRNITWDFTESASAATLCDPGLSDYKDKYFVDNNKVKLKMSGKDEFGQKVEYEYEGLYYDNMTREEQGFIDMIGYELSEANHNRQGNIVVGSTDYSWETIENIKRYIESGKVVELGMTVNLGGAHRVMIYGYEYDNRNPDNLDFYIYDPNFPMISANICKLHVCKTKSKISGKDTFIYRYDPNNNLNYLMTSGYEEGFEYRFGAYDENLNCLTVLN